MDDKKLQAANELKKQIDAAQKEKDFLQSVSQAGLSVRFEHTFYGSITGWTVNKAYINHEVFKVLLLSAINKELDRLQTEYDNL